MGEMIVRLDGIACNIDKVRVHTTTVIFSSTNVDQAVLQRLVAGETHEIG
ncbi:hypothetical protein CP97_14730 [Aurantiacibacter atlanticus]|uniref:Uncharacterized protein n=1 Tax=Aurantiacibacter atlanticus TaxID=1648404 RepID=A0A168M1L0_9SPHN|nr:hypothetical protein CP97_14730 [Aurantiacibacter atlanticus]